MTKTTENAIAENNQTNEVSEIVESRVTANYEISKNADGKFTRKAIYKPFSSVVATTKEEKIALMNLLNSDDVAQPLGDHIGKQISISDVIFQPYDAVDENTGEMEYGVLSYLITPEGVAYVTSSKSVYHTLKKIFMVFGEAHYIDDEIITVEAFKTQGKNFKYTDIKIVG